MGQSTYVANMPIGIQAISAGSAVAGPTISAPSAASATGGVYPNYAIFFCESASARWRDDGTDPTGTVGMPLPVGQYFYYEGRLDRIKFGTAAGLQAIVNCALYRTF
jgi:hypothetical protein